jgi:hypothetical protein
VQCLFEAPRVVLPRPLLLPPLSVGNLETRYHRQPEQTQIALSPRRLDQALGRSEEAGLLPRPVVPRALAVPVALPPPYSAATPSAAASAAFGAPALRQTELVHQRPWVEHLPALVAFLRL